MAKRFTDTNKFDDVWYMELPSKYKLFYDYILSKCDAVGVWKPNVRMASFALNEQIDTEEFLQLCTTERLKIMPNGSWYLVKFCDFQYGFLSEESTSNTVKAYISLLKKHGLYQDYIRGTFTPKDKDMDKDKAKEKGGAGEKRATELLQLLKDNNLPSDLASVWAAYEDFRKTNHKFSFFNNDSKLRAIKELVKFSKGDLHTAERIVQQSIDKNWKGLFELKDDQPKPANGQLKPNYTPSLNEF